MTSIYDRLGKENLHQLVDHFYDSVLQMESLAPLFKTDIVLVKKKQFMFLSQFFGGPPLYAEEYGHPRMRMRHAPHKITPSAAYDWLNCMKSAIEALDISKDFQAEIFQRFPNVAAHMVNAPD